jgi:hypothetical protein
MLIQKAPNNNPKAKIFQITVAELQAVRLKPMLVVSEEFHFVTTIHIESRQM